MRFGLQVINAWSREGNGVENSPKFLLDLAIAAEEAGWEGFFLWDHLLFPWDVPMVEPWTVLAAIGSRTSILKLGTNVTPLPRMKPHILAKRLATLDQLTEGRVVLGAGLGASELDYRPFGEEFNFKTLGVKADEALEVITGLWSGEPFTFEGEHYQVHEVTFLPEPFRKPRIPIWIGGESPAAIKRASRYDGWVIGGPCPSAGEWAHGWRLDSVSEAHSSIMKYREGEDPFDIVYGLEIPEGEDDVENLIRDAEPAGVTWICDSIFGLRCDGREAMEIVREGPPFTR
jgi:alkanesulfonate monooxygenase SsuD/methylene tetrahydromethanopterin reductase-like flavin-dependent oxidoreductase (luciferase family)